MDRLEMVRDIVDEILRQQLNKEKSRCGFVHLYGVASLCGLLALKRNLNSELCSIAGMLHDISSYKTGDYVDHAKLSSDETKGIMGELCCFTEEEIAIICEMILNHSDKQTINGIYSELLKDADVLQHYLYNTSFEINDHERKRLTRIIEELGSSIE
ncbi:HD domain-containing protein [Clostridium sp. CF012]|uniref:HD domain-containing protein n=1 Tax=Clostridium sp. CF012 TaxID=2843319 RepID=UPI001C0D5207|nr:HD domain-containing protein [Clostridium sp. CF012]MBU3143798.1 HD domain-containing protein [Clostridium sp. CF012]